MSTNMPGGPASSGPTSGTPANTMLLDGGIAGGLLLALILVFVIDALSRPGQSSGPKLDINVTRGTGQNAAPRKSLRLAVSYFQFDDLGGLLQKLGEGYKNFDNLSLGDLQRRDKLRDYDVIFLTCAATKPGDVLMKTALREFVEQKGGTLYASDLRFDALKDAFPEFIDAFAIKPGRQDQTVKATIHDKGLENALGKGKQVDLFFESPGWRPAAFFRNKVKVYLTGDYQPDFGEKIQDAPLLVQFNVGKGTVIFTSFHNSRQGEVAEKLLRYLVFSAVTAKASAEMNRKIEQGGLSPAKSSLISASAENPKVTHTYKSTKKGKLLFALAFNPEGNAKLRLTVKGPDGKVATHEDGEAFTIEVPNAPLGEWEYTVEALNLPYPNFPFTVTVAEPK